MIKKAGGKASISSSTEDLKKAKSIVIPGVGNFSEAMKILSKKEYIPVLNEKALVEKVPILGICLGMQLLFKQSEEGNSQGLGWIDGEVKKFKMPGLKVPNIGWSYINEKNNSPLLLNMPAECRFYFVHSYFVECKREENVIATAHHGKEFHCAVQNNNIYGTQFHPEKSHKFGMQIIKNFIAISNG